MVNRRNCMTGILWSMFFGYFLFLSSHMDKQASYWPRMICIIGLVLSALSVITSALQPKNEKGDGSLFPFSSRQMKRILITLFLMVIWMLGIGILGFLASSVAAMTGLFIIFEPNRTKLTIARNIIIAFVFAIGIYALFTALGISFPKGMFL